MSPKKKKETKKKTSGKKKKSTLIPYHCSYDEIVPIEFLKPNPQNPNTHTKDQINLLSEIFKVQGIRKAIVVSRNSGYIVAGHGRLEAAKKIGMKEFPVDYQSYETPQLELADLLADNKIAELATIDNSLLTEILEKLEGFPEKNLTGYIEGDFREVERKIQQLGDPEYQVLVSCKNEKDQVQLIESLIDKGFECKAIIV